MLRHCLIRSAMGRLTTEEMMDFFDTKSHQQLKDLVKEQWDSCLEETKKQLKVEMQQLEQRNDEASKNLRLGEECRCKLKECEGRPPPTKIVEKRVEVPGPETIVKVPGPPVEVPGPERIVKVQGPVRYVKVQGPARYDYRRVEGPVRYVYQRVEGPVRYVYQRVQGPVRYVYQRIEVPGPVRYVYQSYAQPCVQFVRRCWNNRGWGRWW